MKPPMKRYCNLCGREFETYQSSRRFCSDQCRLKSHRETHRQPTKLSDKLIKQYETKHNQFYSKTCSECNGLFMVNGAQMMQMYCSDTCRKAVARQRRENKHQHFLMRFQNVGAYQQAAK